MPRLLHLINTALLLSLVSLTACEELDCPLLNTAYANYGFYDAESEASVTLRDTLTVTPYGRDTVLINRVTGVSSIDLPVSYAGDADTLLFQFRRTGGIVTDTVVFAHTNEPHFESIDCNTAIFHTVTGVSLHTMNANGGSAIHSVTIANATINYDTQEHFKVYLNSR